MKHANVPYKLQKHNERPPCCSQQRSRRLFMDSMVETPQLDSGIESSENHGSDLRNLEGLEHSEKSPFIEIQREGKSQIS